ncbi:hypothetical protein HYY75_07290, partial [bacterium]|nr:hypothetical protein [bacterium]
MLEERFQQAISDFLGAFDDLSFQTLIDELRDFIISRARSWKNSGTDFSQRCREIISEIFLIFREEFNPEKSTTPRSVLAYLSLRLRRLTRPKGNQPIPLGLSPELPDVGRFEFNSFRLEFIEQLVLCVRQEIANPSYPDTGLLEFLFIKVSPNLAGSSRFLAQQFQENVQKRIEADKKRHQAFNERLRKRFEKISFGDWTEVSSWPTGQRSHLAWRIIIPSPSEIEDFGSHAGEMLSNWRDQIDPFSEPNFPNFFLVQKGVEVLSKLYGRNLVNLSEEAAPYEEFTPGISDTILKMLEPTIRKKLPLVREDKENAFEKEIDFQAPPNDTEIEAFKKALHEIIPWIRTLGKPL